MSPRGFERRKHIRYPRRFSGQISSPGPSRTPSLEIETADISVGGAVCTSPVLVPVMTRLQISLFIPSEDGRGTPPLDPLVLQGCVVRAEPAPAGDARGAYRLALLFTEMAASDREILARYLMTRPKKSPSDLSA